MKLKVGQIYFWNSNEGLFGKAITYFNKKVFGRSDATHCGIIAQILDDDVLIYEAGNKGFLASWYSRDFLENNKNVHIGEVKETMLFVKQNCDKYQGIRYGWLDILGIGLSYLFGWRVLGITGKNALICSEAVSRVIYDCTKQTNFSAEYGVKYDAVTPQHIFQSKFVKIIK